MDWLKDAQPITGLSYLLAAIGLAFTCLLGLDSKEKFFIAWLVGFVASIASIAAPLREHPGAQLPEIVANVEKHQLLVNISQGTGGFENANKATQDLASVMVNSGQCASQNLTRIKDLAANFWPAVYLEPEWDVLLRIVGGKNEPPMDYCTKNLRKLIESQPDLFAVK